MCLYVIDSPPFVSAGYSEINMSERDVIKLCYFPFECSDFFVQVFYVTYYRILLSETKGPHHIHTSSLRSSCFIKKSAFNVAGNLVMFVKFTFQSIFGNSRQNPRHASARGREEPLDLYSILWSDWPTSKQKVLRHGNRSATLVCRRHFSEREKRRPGIRLLFAG